MTFESKFRSDGYWPVYKGESFDTWLPDTGVYYAWADPEPVLEWLQCKRMRAGKSRRDSAHQEFSMEHLENRATLPCFRPRIALPGHYQSNQSAHGHRLPRAARGVHCSSSTVPFMVPGR